MNYILRKTTEKDYDFLKSVHHATLKPHVSKIWGWDKEEQDKYFLQNFSPNRIQLIKVKNTPIGYLEINEEDAIINITNILILPEFQGRGIGSKIIDDLIVKAKKHHKKVQLGVFKVNVRAKKLYESIGFEIYRESETHFFMQID